MPPRKRSNSRPLSRGGKGTVTATVNAVDVIHDMPSEYLQCRDFGHSWRPFTAKWDQQARAYEVQLRCQRCRTKRHRFIGQHGELVSSSYDYADGYLVKGMGRLDSGERNAMRLESVLRVLPDDALADE